MMIWVLGLNMAFGHSSEYGLGLWSWLNAAICFNFSLLVFNVYVHTQSIYSEGITTIGKFTIVNEVRCEINDYGDALIIKIMLVLVMDEFLW